MTPAGKGTVAAIVAFTLWGVLPLYWKLFEGAPPVTIIAHRMVWSLAVLLPVVHWSGRLREVGRALRQPRIGGLHFLSGSLLTANWILYVWATLNERIIEGALGYYLNPFLTMLLGFLFFGERQNRWQMTAIALALIGVAFQFPAVDGLPWVAVTLAVTFALYGFVRKRATLGSLSGLAVETAVLAPFAAAFLWFAPSGEAAAPDPTAGGYALLATTGVVTVVPLLCFGLAARNLRLTTLGMLQFIGPTCQLFIGWLVYGEPMPAMRLASFGFIWAAVLLYAIDAARRPGGATPVGGRMSAPADTARR